MSAMSAMLELDELEPILGGNCMTPGPRPVSQRFGHPRVLGIPIPISLAFWVSPSHITAAFWASPGTLPGCPNP